MKTVKLKNSEVTLKEELTWGDVQKIKDSIAAGARMHGKAKEVAETGDIEFDYNTGAMLESKYVALECVVVKIKEGDKEFDFSREWMDSLPVSDGDKLYEAVDEIADVKKNGETSKDE